MSTPAPAVHPEVQALCQQIDAIGTRTTQLAKELMTERDVLKAALQRMVEAHVETQSDSDGRWPYPDAGCIECTCNTVPNRLNTGPCAFHHAQSLLASVGGTKSHVLTAAPDLLAALRAAVTELWRLPDGSAEVLVMALIAIAKAEDRTP